MIFKYPGLALLYCQARCRACSPSATISALSRPALLPRWPLSQLSCLPQVARDDGGVHLTLAHVTAQQTSVRASLTVPLPPGSALLLCPYWDQGPLFQVFQLMSNKDRSSAVMTPGPGLPTASGGEGQEGRGVPHPMGEKQHGQLPFPWEQLTSTPSMCRPALFTTAAH